MPRKPPPAWVFRPLVAWATLPATVGLALSPVWELILALNVIIGLQVYEDRRYRALPHFVWPTAVASYGSVPMIAYAYNRRESLGVIRPGAPPSPEEYAAQRGAALAAARPGAAPAAWYADPLRQRRWRYWDGRRWTEHVAD